MTLRRKIPRRTLHKLLLEQYLQRRHGNAARLLDAAHCSIVHCHAGGSRVKFGDPYRNASASFGFRMGRSGISVPVTEFLLDIERLLCKMNSCYLYGGMTVSPRVTREYSEFRRRQIVTAAWECFTEKGYHETTIRDVARKLELSTGIVYRYFKGKAEILEAVHECGRANTAEFIERMMRKGTAREAIQEFIRAVLMQAPAKDRRRNARGAIGLWAEALKRPAYLRIYRTQYRLVAKRLSQIFADGIKRQEFRKKVDPEALAGFLLALVSGLQVQLILNEGRDTESFCRNICNILSSNLWK